MNDHCHLREENINKMLAQIEQMVDGLSTHSNRFMSLAKRIYEDHLDNMLSSFKMLGFLACNHETKAEALTLLDNLRAWNLLMEQVSDTLIDISQDLVGFFDATELWAATEAEQAMSMREAHKNVEELESV